MKIRIGISFWFYFTGALISGLVQGFFVGTFGMFEDIGLYYYFYKRVADAGLYEAVVSFTVQTGKFEPITFLFFKIEYLLSCGYLTEYSFIILNLFLLNSVLALVMWPSISRKANSRFVLLFAGFFVTSGYLVFSKMMYVWRSILAFVFFMLFIRSISFKRIFWGILAIISHYTFFIFILLYLAIETIGRFKKSLALYCMLTIVLITFTKVGLYLPMVFSMFVSGGVVEIFYEKSTHGIYAMISIVFSLTILVLIFDGIMHSGNFRLKSNYMFCFISVIVCICNYENYQLMQRIFLPASLIVGFLPFVVVNNTLRFKLARIAIVLSIIPTIRIWSMLAADTFL